MISNLLTALRLTAEIAWIDLQLIALDVEEFLTT